jgi:hypothetical protein
VLKSQDTEPPQELVQALLEEFPHAKEKQAICALQTTRARSEPGKPGWRIVHAAKLMPPIPPGAAGNPIMCLSSDSSPEALAKEARALRKAAMNSKEAWCEELHLSLGIEKEFLAQVFDTCKPRSLETLAAFAISELAEELGQDPQELARDIRERQRKQSDGEGAAAQPAHPKQPGDDDEDGDALGEATRQLGGGGTARAASAAASAHDKTFTREQHGNAGKQRELGATLEQPQAGGGEQSNAASCVQSVLEQLQAGGSGQSNAANCVQKGSADTREIVLTPVALPTFLQSIMASRSCSSRSNLSKPR